MITTSQELYQHINEGKHFTNRAACILISAYLARIGIDIAPEDVWNYSPTGELSQVYHLYCLALDWLDSRHINNELTKEELTNINEALGRETV